MHKELQTKQDIFNLRLICLEAILFSSFGVCYAQPSVTLSTHVQIRVLLEGAFTNLSVATAQDCESCAVPDMVIVPSGTFIMGSAMTDIDRHDHEGPQHWVNIQSFAVGKYEVTRGQFAAFVTETGYDAGSCRHDSEFSWRDPGFTQTDKHPVVCVSWHDARAYINWLSEKSGQSYRLLTEAEWEYVARAGTTGAYHFGTIISASHANYSSDNSGTVVVGSRSENDFGLYDMHGNELEWTEDCYPEDRDIVPLDGGTGIDDCDVPTSPGDDNHSSNSGGTVVVGSYPKNDFGLYDMHGNVWEWVEDCYHDDYTGAPPDGNAWLSDCDDPNVRVRRGGGWRSDLTELRSAYRVSDNAKLRFDHIGFRVARDLPPPLQIVAPEEGTIFNLLSASDETEATTASVTVVIDSPQIEDSVTMMLKLNAGGESIVSISDDKMNLAPTGNSRRTAKFTLTAIDAGYTTVTIVVMDGSESQDQVRIRVAVASLPDMVVVPSGTFMMGSTAAEISRARDEEPRHRVSIRSFAVGKYEVTRGQFAAFIAETGYDAGSCQHSSDASWRNPGFTQTDTHPAVCVSWHDAQAYIDWLSTRSGQQYRLLSEAEWEYAARAGTTTAYHFGTTASASHAHYWYQDSPDYSGTDPGYFGTVEVGSYPANDFGLYDMHGNAREWVEDCYHDDYTGAPSDGSAWTNNCFFGSSARVYRGGAWFNLSKPLRSANRDWILASISGNGSGFRIARDLPLQIVAPAEGAIFDLLSASDITEATTASVTMVIKAAEIEDSVTMMLRLNAGGESVVSVSTGKMNLAPTGDTRRTAKFTLAAIDLGYTTLTITVMDSSGNRDRVRIRVVVSPSVPDMVVVPSGTFTMGSTITEINRDKDEGPQYRLSIRSFAVGKYEVTRGQFAVFVATTGYETDSCWRNPGFTQTGTHPVACVSWHDAQAYINWLSARSGQQYRLLTEAEWEYAARAGTTGAYHFGATISPSQANYRYNGGGKGTVEVGSYPANAFGLHNVHGNVREWVEDCYHNDYNGAPSDGSAWTSDCYYENEDNKSYVLRGGSWRDFPRSLRSANRTGIADSLFYKYIGFRVARTLSP